MKRIPQEISVKLANMGFVCTCLVVQMHVRCGWEGAGINQIAVPFFFAMSGYLLAGHTLDAGWYGRETRKRIRSILVPLFVWSCIWAAYIIPMAIFLNFRAGREPFANLMTGWSALRYVALDPTFRPALGPLWYLRTLMLFVLVSPLLVALIRRWRWIALSIAAAGYVCYAMYCRQIGHRIEFFTFFLSPEGLFYFMLGLSLRIGEYSLKIKPIIGGTVLFAGVLLYMMNITELSLLLMIVGLWGVIPAVRIPVWLTANSFPVYLIHMFVLSLFSGLGVVSPLMAIIIGMLGVAGSLCVSLVMRRLMPNFSCICFGGR